MNQWLTHHSYLVAAVIMAVLSTLLALALRTHRRAMLLSGVLGLPFGVASFLFIPEYWNPVLLFHWVTSIEDMLFTYTAGVLGWWFAAWPFGNRIVLRGGPKIYFRRWLLLMTTGGAILTPWYCLAGRQSIMTAVICAGVVVLAILWTLDRNVIRLSLTGGATFTIVYYACTWLYWWLWPASRSFWTAGSKPTWQIGGVPAFEVLWGMAFGATWPAMFAWCMQAELMPGSASTTPGNPGTELVSSE